MDARKPLNPEVKPGDREGSRRSVLPRILVLLGLALAAAAAVALYPRQARELAEAAVGRVTALLSSSEEHDEAEAGGRAQPTERVFRPTPEQRATLEIQFVDTVTFRPEATADGRIALNDDDNVPVATPYSGRVVKVMVRAGDSVKAGDVLLTMEASDMVQAQNDYQSARNAISKATALLKLDQTIAARQQELFAAKAVALKDYQSAQNDVIAAESDLRTAEGTFQAVRNRLRLLGKTDAEIAAFEKSGAMSAVTEIRAPIGGTIVQRKVGTGQYISSSGDAVFIIGDLSTVWLVANVRESEISRIRLGQEVEARVTGFGNRFFKARLNYIAASLDPATRRLAVRAEVDNAGGLLKPEMFATFTIVTGPGQPSSAVPLAAVVYEGSDAHVWRLRKDGAIEACSVKLGLVSGEMVQILDGLANDDRVVTRGALFIDRATSGDKAS